MKSKIIILMIVIVLFTIFVSQNTLVIPVNIFFWQVQMSAIVLMSLSVLTGVLMGFIFLKILEYKERKQNRRKEDTRTVKPAK